MFKVVMGFPECECLSIRTFFSITIALLVATNAVACVETHDGTGRLTDHPTLPQSSKNGDELKVSPASTNESRSVMGVCQLRSLTRLQKGSLLEVAPAPASDNTAESRTMDVSGWTVRAPFNEEGYAYLRLPPGRYFFLQPSALWKQDGEPFQLSDGSYFNRKIFVILPERVTQVEMKLMGLQVDRSHSE